MTKPNARTTIYAAFSGDGVPCVNVYDFNKARLVTLLNDRRQNGEALSGEHIVHCTLADYNRQLAALGLPPVRPLPARATGAREG
jgi:hypothetical protein